MNIILSSTVEAIGWSLLHFLWQGTVVALLAAGILQLLRKRAPQLRYLVSGVAFLMMIGAFVVTLSFLWQSALPPVALGDGEISPSSVPGRVSPPLNSEKPSTTETKLLPLAGGVPTEPLVAEPPEAKVVVAEPEVVEDKVATASAGVPPVEFIRPALPWVVMAWLGGVILCLLRLLSGWLRIRRWQKSGELVVESELLERFAALCHALRVSRPVRLLSSTTVAVPIVVGWLKPTILIPARLLTGLSTGQLEAILAHELAHIRRHDYLVNLLQNVVETIFFFHPAVWWISAQLRKEREHCCDDAASVQCGGAVDYAKALAALEEMRGAPISSVAATGGSLLNRVRRLLGVAPRKARPAVSLVAGLVVSVLIVSLVATANPAPPPSDDGNEAEKENTVPSAGDDAQATAKAGRWMLADGLDFEIVVEDAPLGAIKETTAILRWPAEGRQAARSLMARSLAMPIAGGSISHLAAGNANQHPWAMAWEKNKPVLWLATGKMGEWDTLEEAYKQGATTVTKISYADPDRVVATSFTGWDAKERPSDECIAALDAVLKVPPKGREDRKTIQWGTRSEQRHVVDALQIEISLEDNKGTCNLGLPIARLPDFLRAEVGKRLKDWPQILKTIPPKERAKFEGEVLLPRVVVVAAPEVTDETIEKVVKACAKADVGPVAQLSRKANAYHERWSFMDSLDVSKEIEGNLKAKDREVLLAMCEAIPHHKWDGGDPKHHFYPSEVVMEELKEELAQLKDEQASAVVGKAVKFLDDLGRKRFEARRVEIPEEEYRAGAPLEKLDREIIWNEPNEVGLRLGISGIASGEKFPQAQRFPTKFYLRNDGNETIKVSPTTVFNEGVRAWLTDEKGVRHALRKSPTGPMGLEHRKIAPGHYVTLKTSPLMFWMKPGKYTLEVEHLIGQWLGRVKHLRKDDPQAVPGIDDWRGTLKIGPIPLEITDYQAVNVSPGSKHVIQYLTRSEGLKSWHARVQFEKNQITVTHGHRPKPKVRIGWAGEPAHVWKPKSGDYRAAYEIGAARRLWIVDGGSILCLGMVAALEEEGRWTAKDIRGDLGGMSVGIRRELGLPLEIKQGEVRTGRPGDLVELPTGQALFFRKGHIELAKTLWHRGHKFTEFKGAYRAASVTGMSKLWVVDEAGILMLDLNKYLAVAGRWSLAEAAGDLGGMPEEVRTALVLPIPIAVKADPPEDTAVPTVRGLSLAGIPTASKDKIEKGSTFEMSVKVDGSKPTMIYPVGKPHFYLEVEDLIYGPVAGNPFEKLKLTEVLTAQLDSVDAKAASEQLFDMINSGDEVLRVAAYKVIPRMKKSLSHLALSYAISKQLNLNPPAPTAKLGRAALRVVRDAHYAEVHDEAKARWEEMSKVAVPLEEYKPGKQTGLGDTPILWGDANEVGLRLGVAGLPTEKALPVGHDSKLRLFVRNDGKQEVKINPTGLWGVGLQIVLTDKKGNKIALEGARGVRGLEPRVRLAPNRQYECQLIAPKTIVPKLDGSPSRIPRGLELSWALQPGRYQMELSYNIGVFEISADWREPDPRAVPAPGEWTGTLQATPMELHFGPPEIVTATPGNTVELSRRHRLRFAKGKIELAHYAGWPGQSGKVRVQKENGEWEMSPWGPTHDVWETKDPSGAYLAAWDVGGTRLWYVDGTGVQYLEIHKELQDRGHWTRQEGKGVLADMPDGVRKALMLPARVIAKPEGASSKPEPVRGKRLPAYKPDGGSEKYLGFLKSARESHGLNEGDPDPIAWGKTANGLQAGLLLPGRVNRGSKVGGWILIRNTSEQVKDFKVVYSWNTVRLLATDGAGKKLATADWFMKLRGGDAILPVQLLPGEHVEFRLFEMAITSAPVSDRPYVKISADAVVARLHFDLGRVMGRNAGFGTFETGAAEIVIEPAAPQDAIKPAAELERARPGLYALTPTVKVRIEQSTEGANLPNSKVTLSWEDGLGNTVARKELSLLRHSKVPPMFALDETLWVEVTPIFGSGFRGVRRIDFSKQGKFEEQAWNAGELSVTGNRLRGIPEKITRWLSRERIAPIREGFTVRQAAKGNENDFTKVVLSHEHVDKVGKLQTGNANRRIVLQLNDEGGRLMRRTLADAPDQKLRISVEGDLLLTELELKNGNELILKGPFDNRSVVAIASYLGGVVSEKLGSWYMGDAHTPVIEILKAGEYNVGDRYRVTITETNDGEFLRNELRVSFRDDAGKERVGTYALPYGAGTWAILTAVRKNRDVETLNLAIASAEGIFELRTHPTKGLERVHWPIVSMYRVPGIWHNWFKRVKPTLKEENKPAGPVFELRLIAEDDEKVELVCRTGTRNGQSERSFVRMGSLLLDGSDVTRNPQMLVEAGQMFTKFEIREGAREAFAEFCAKYKGRTAALVQDGVIWTTVDLKPGLKSVSSPMAFGSGEPMLLPEDAESEEGAPTG